MIRLAEVLRELKKPFKPEEVEWRVQRKSRDGTKGMALAYIDARAITNRLDKLVEDGFLISWEVHYSSVDMGTVTQQRGGSSHEVPVKGFICHLRLNIPYVEQDQKDELDYPLDGEWVSREDGAGITDFEPFKGGLSGALKRAASAWGIGRYLYDLPTVWAPIDNWGNITQKPNLPLWALPEGYVQEQPQQSPPSVAAVGSEDLFSMPDDSNPFTDTPDAGESSGEFIFPFGKHKGKPISEVPADYLKWCLTNMQRLDPKTKAAIEGTLTKA